MESTEELQALSASRRAQRDRLKTYSPQVVDQLLRDSPAATQRNQADFSESLEWHQVDHLRGSSAPGGIPTTRWERTQAQRQAKDAVRRAQQEAFMQSVKARKEAAEHAKDAAFQRDYEDVLAGLACGSGEGWHIMGETQGVLDHKQKIKSKKQAALYGEWRTEVFDKIQGRLQRAVDARSERDIMARLKTQMDEYIHTSNTKLGVFRDVIIEQDYDPLKAHQHTIRIPTGDIRDPVKRDVLKPMYERALMGVTSPADLLPPGKQTLDTKMWGQLAIHSTPYGHNVDATGDNVLVPMSERAIAGRKSRIPMDHYDYPQFDNQAAAAELGRMGKRTGILPESLGGRRDLTDLLTQTCWQRPEFTGGDLWLEAKGKGSAPGPEQRRGRQGLFDVVSHTCHLNPGTTGGDQWLEAKGKAMPPGPEQRRGRADLSEIVQQSSNPYQDGRSLGDQWLEMRGKGAAPGPKETVREFINRMDCEPDPAKVRDARRYRSVLVNDKTLHPTK